MITIIIIEPRFQSIRSKLTVCEGYTPKADAEIELKIVPEQQQIAVPTLTVTNNNNYYYYNYYYYY